jgi:hypothetical protein
VGDRRSVRLASVSRPRRRLIAHLAERPDQPHSVSALAEALLPEKDKADLRSAFELQLHHVHLPALQDDGLIDYDADAKRVVSVEASALAAAVDLLESESENGDD